MPKPFGRIRRLLVVVGSFDRSSVLSQIDKVLGDGRPALDGAEGEGAGWPGGPQNLLH